MPKPKIFSKNIKNKNQVEAGEAGAAGIDGVLRIKKMLEHQGRSIQRVIFEIKKTVRKYGRQNIEDALGPDSGELEELFQALKAAAESLGIDDIGNLDN